MRTVYQLDDVGCGIACVAMICGVTYKKARQVLFGKSTVKRTSSGKLFKAIQTLGRKPTAQRMRSLKDINLGDLAYDCLVGCTLNGDRHWVVWDATKRKVRDPYKGGGKLKIIKYTVIK
jgi:uncharacterized protein (UPF0128 family)